MRFYLCCQYQKFYRTSCYGDVCLIEGHVGKEGGWNSTYKAFPYVRYNTYYFIEFNYAYITIAYSRPVSEFYSYFQRSGCLNGTAAVRFNGTTRHNQYYVTHICGY